MVRYIAGATMALALVGCAGNDAPTPNATSTYTICETHNCGDPVTVTVDESK